MTATARGPSFGAGLSRDREPVECRAAFTPAPAGPGPGRPPLVPPVRGHGKRPVRDRLLTREGANRALPHRTWAQAEQEVVLQVELEVEVEPVLVQPAGTTSPASE